jgi:hypothetical protein
MINNDTFNNVDKKDDIVEGQAMFIFLAKLSQLTIFFKMVLICVFFFIKFQQNLLKNH